MFNFDFRYWLDKRHFTLRNRISLYERLASLIENGSRPRDALIDMKLQYDERGITGSGAKMVSCLLTSFGKNDRIDEALRPYVPTREIMIISAAVAQNEVAEGFRIAADMSSDIHEFQSHAKKKMGYPVFLYIMSIALTMGGYFLLSQFVSFRPPEEWDEMSRNYYYFGQFLVHNFVFFLAGLIAFIYVMKELTVRVPAESKRVYQYHALRCRLDKVPPFSIYKLFASFTFLTTLTGLIRAGVVPRDALLQIYENTSDYLRMHIILMIDYLINSTPGRAISETKLMSDEQAMSITIISQTADFSQAIETAAKESMKSAKRQMDSAMSLIALFGWIAAAAAITMLALSQFSVVLSMSADY